MKLVVTGGAGYIGSNVAALLLEAGHEVVVLDNLSEGRESNIPEGAEFVKADVSDFGKVFSRADKIDAVLHFASSLSAGESVKKPEKYWQNNTVASLALIEDMRQLGIKKLIFSSTAAVYGNPEVTPITEDARTAPLNPYGMSKLAVDMIISSEASAHGLAAASLRYFNVAGAYKRFGERHDPETHIIPLALRAASEQAEFTIFGDDYDTADGTCVRDYIHVRDLANAHLLALAKLKPGAHSIYNLGNGQGFSNLEVLKAVEKVTGKKLNYKTGPRRDGDPATLVASSELAQRELGWKPEITSLERIIRDAWEHYKTIQP
jgi:UDP-glucose 4-epimerase